MAIYIRQLEAIQEAAGRMAASLGHALLPWEPGISAWNGVTTCTECGLYACATSQPDDDEDGPIFGSTTQVKCAGAGTIPSWAPQLKGSTAP